MLAKGKLDSHARVLLIAPTTSAVARIAFETDAASLVPCDGNVHVVHGTEDTTFCPNQTRWIGDNLHRIHDNHVFFEPSSKIFLQELLISLLDDSPIVRRA
jgi:hypothetical protein